MSFNILDAVKGHLTPDLISKAGSFLGESDSGIAKAISGILPSLLGGLASKSTSGGAGAEEVFNLAKETHSSGFLGNLGNLFSDGGSLLTKGTGLLKNIFGNKADGIIDAIAGFAGVKKSSASSLMSMAAPTALSTLGKHAIETGLSAGGLMSLLSSQKSSILSMLPDGLSSLAGMVGLGKISDTVSSFTNGSKKSIPATRSYADDTVRKAGGGLKWLLPLLLAAAAVFAIWYFWRGCNNKKGSDNTTIADTTTINQVLADENTTIILPAASIDSVSGLISYDLGKDMEFSLPNGVKFTAAEKGFESLLLSFIKSGSVDTINKSANWFNMFDVQFKSGGNEYTGKAEAQLKNCAAILKAYPAVKIKLGGYTDNTGSVDANIAISQQRADRVKADVIKMGVMTDQVVEAVGYGPQFPVCEANDTKECQARNRRVACKVAIK